MMIASGWIDVPLKRIARLQYGDALSADAREEGSIPVFGSNGIVGSHCSPNTRAPAIIVGRKGSFGKLAFSNVPAFCIDTAFFIDRRTASCDLRWLFYALQTLRLDDASQSQDTGVPGLSREAAHSRYVRCPPLATQQSIANFLDRKTADIDTLIEQKERLLRLLDEKRQAAITQAVTKGLDPSVPMKKGSSVWFPLLPAHWQSARVKNVVWKVADGPHFSPPYVDRDEDGFMFLSARNIKVDGWALDDAKYISRALFNEFSRRVVPVRGDVLYTKGGTTGIARAVDFDEPFQVWVHVAVLKVRKALVHPEFLAYVLNSGPCYEQAQLHTRGATNQDLGLTRLVNIEFPLPPLAEQAAIVTKLGDVLGDLREGRRAVEAQIVVLREYRQAVITAAVTGKLDVTRASREAA